MPGEATRPTSDRVRESLFNILGASVREAVVLDLFAGTGALGIEALSRGAAFGVFIENARAPLGVIRRNLEACGLGGRSRILRWDASRNLNCLASAGARFDLVLMDPPYRFGRVAAVLGHLAAAGCLTDGAEVVVEQELRSHLTEPPEPFRIEDQRRYGKTVVSFLRYVL